VGLPNAYLGSTLFSCYSGNIGWQCGGNLIPFNEHCCGLRHFPCHRLIAENKSH
jgi:hypothetical protein